MTDDSSARFPKLNDTNYAQWSIMMEAELTRKGLWTNIVEVVVEKDGKTEEEVQKDYMAKLVKRSASKMAEARSEMILRVDGGQLPHMISRDPLEVWSNLRTVHRARGFATSLALHRKFLTLRKTLKMTMQAWIGEIRGQAFAMKLAEIEVSDQMVILALTLGLPPSYDNVIINFDSTDPIQLTLENVIVRLLNEETRQSSRRTQAVDTPRPDFDNAAMAAVPIPRGKIACFFCDQVGHYKSECPEKAKWDTFKLTTTSTGEANAVFAVDDDDDDEDEDAF
jgi:hypothetical protein